MTNVLYTDKIDRGFVLGNKVLVAEVFAKHGFLVLSIDTGEENTSIEGLLKLREKIEKQGLQVRSRKELESL